jgi:hypothetical protein
LHQVVKGYGRGQPPTERLWPGSGGVDDADNRDAIEERVAAAIATEDSDRLVRRPACHEVVALQVSGLYP